MHLRKSLTLDDVALKLEGEAGTFEGYASKWDSVDSYGDTIVKGAFADTLKSNGQPKLFLEHSWKLGGALLPIGKAQCTEDDVGLRLKGELTPGLTVAADVHAAMKHGTISGLSIGGLIKKGDYEEKEGGGKVIKRWHNLVDVSVVAYPAEKGAQIDLSTVKNIDFEALLPECKTERDIERLLRDAGLGKWESMAIVSRVKAILGGRDAPEDEDTRLHAQILERMRRIAA
jgi:HK97 family phage prohead protease